MLAPVAIEHLLGIDVRTQRRWAERTRRDALAPGSSPGRPPKIDPTRHNALRAQVVALPDATLAAHCDRWAETTGVRVSPSTMSRTLAALGRTRKKRV